MPTYWAMEGFLDVILEGAGLPDVVVPTTALIGFILLFLAVAALRFRFEETKVYVA